ncbi:NADP-dependent 3-hydroxy acid dehydrogenase YdfG [Klenkia marina]|uniref:NADP-dependent 3-hydroxy acid dehydrogenase YdfG n=1 Tax=Klenkia marina TaxID=1960309 RepID=A0A1G4YNK7_9ACTN|nr:SDR family NAD(P)-dependent oxidoreductase [Klenkia marina]SCX55047.1 NADP-dependent 3-hydroxy acid dehydrogenase YdfG [Klenkia marina]
MSEHTPRPGSVALITGGAGGFGRALATRLRDADVRVVLADLDSERNRSVAAELGVGFAVLDVTDHAANQRVVADVEAEHGRLDAAFLNAGIASSAGTDALDVADYLRVIAVDLHGVVFGTDAARPALRRAGGGSIVVTASLAGLSPMPTDQAYSIAKGGAVAFVRSIGPVLHAEGTTISAICPGFADTAIIDPWREHFEAAEFPVLSADEVAAAMQAAWAGADPGAAYVVQPGVGAIPYRFKGVPAAKTADGGSAAVPAHLRGPL